VEFWHGVMQRWTRSAFGARMHLSVSGHGMLGITGDGVDVEGGAAVVIWRGAMGVLFLRLREDGAG